VAEGPSESNRLREIFSMIAAKSRRPATVCGGKVETKSFDAVASVQTGQAL
jgi:hypothetical protein